MTETLLLEIDGGFRWFVISEYNNHIVAQGFTRARHNALRQLQEEQLKFEAIMA